MGKDMRLDENRGGEVFAKAQWKGFHTHHRKNECPIETASQPSVNGSEITHYNDRWELSGDGQVLTVEADDPKQVSVYDKLPK